MLDVLAAFSTEQPTLSLSEVTHQLGLAVSTVRRILEVLERRGFVRLNPLTGRYSLSVEVVRLSAVAVHGSDLIAAARGPLDALRDATGENVQLSALVGSDLVFVDRRETNQMIKIFSPRGFRAVPWDGRASGQVLLAWLPEDELVDMLPKQKDWHPRTDKLPQTPAAFLKLLRQVRENGYAINDELTERDVWAVSAPVRDHTGRVVAAVSIPVLKSRVTDPARVQTLVAAAVSTCRQISTELHYLG